jgi:hypothetical protein
MRRSKFACTKKFRNAPTHAETFGAGENKLQLASVEDLNGELECHIAIVVSSDDG